jgi:hypothetical protein
VAAERLCECGDSLAGRCFRIAVRRSPSTDVDHGLSAAVGQRIPAKPGRCGVGAPQRPRLNRSCHGSLQGRGFGDGGNRTSVRSRRDGQGPGCSRAHRSSARSQTIRVPSSSAKSTRGPWAYRSTVTKHRSLIVAAASHKAYAHRVNEFGPGGCANTPEAAVPKSNPSARRAAYPCSGWRVGSSVTQRPSQQEESP